MTSLAQATTLSSRSLTPGHRGLVNCKADVRLERIPYPYRAMLAICSDLDETRSPFVYFETMRFLNTTEETSIGCGVGLEVGNTLYFDMPPGAFSYWNCDENERAGLREVMRSGHIDCFHSFGDLATSREDALRTLDELDRHQCRLTTWVDHATAPTNFGEDIMMGRGDVTDGPCYHADATIAHGVKYVWRGRVSSIIGQDCPRSFQGLFDPRHPLESSSVITKEFGKVQSALFGQRKYEMHAANRVTRAGRLRDGQAVHEFMRFDPFWGGVGRAATADGFPEILTDRMLDVLVERSGIGVFYTHLGRTANASGLMSSGACNAFRGLAKRFRNHDVLVLTTTRLLDYVTARDYLDWDAWRSEQGIVVRINSIEDPVTGNRVPNARELGGLTFSIAGEEQIVVELANKQTIDSKVSSERGRSFVSLPFAEIPLPKLSKRLTDLGKKA